MIISLIAALAANRVIGYQNTIPWYLSADLAWFKRTTLNKPIIIGRKTFESIGKPLSNRLNIVISRIPRAEKNVIWVTSPQQALLAAGNVKETIIIGGGEIYNTFLPQANRLYLTNIDIKVEGDTWFPDYKLEEWQLTFNKFYCADHKNTHHYCFKILDRR